jgi:hypothetical protein
MRKGIASWGMALDYHTTTREISKRITGVW